MGKEFSSLNFHHSISITHHSSLITHHSFFHTHLATSLYFHHSIFFTLFMSPTPVTLSEHFCFVTRVTFSSPSGPLSFLISPSPSPSALSLSQSRNPNAFSTQKNFSFFLTASGPSPRQNTEGLRRAQWRDLLRRDPFPSSANE